MKFDLKVFCCHPEKNKNVECELIEADVDPFLATFRCPECKREIVFQIKEETTGK